MSNEFQVPYSYNGSTSCVDDPEEVKTVQKENKHLAKEITWLSKRNDRLSTKLKDLGDKVEKLKSDPNYNVSLAVLRKCLLIRNCRKASSEVKKAFKLLGMLKGVTQIDEEMGDKNDLTDDNDDIIQADYTDSETTSNFNFTRASNGINDITVSGLLRSRKKVKARRSPTDLLTNNSEQEETHQVEVGKSGAETNNKSLRKKMKSLNKNRTSSPSPPSIKQEYICDQCGKVFTGPKAKGKLTSHVRYHNTPRLMVECKICGKKVKGKYKLVQHTKDHSREKEFKCMVCNKEFLYKYNLSRHMLLHSGEKPYECEVCHRTFRQKNQAEQHMERIHVKKKIPHMHSDKSRIFQCLDCDASFTYFNCLVFHLKSTHVVTDLDSLEGEGEVILFNSITQRHLLHYMKELPLIKGFSNLSLEKQLTHFEHPNHIDKCCSGDKTFQKHLGFKRRKNYPCVICGLVYAHQGALQVHMRIHTDERPYQCVVCFKSFRQRTHLATHTRYHMGIKRYKCSFCGKGYSAKPDLVKHLEKIHNQEQISNSVITITSVADTSIQNQILLPQSQLEQQEHHQHNPQLQQQHNPQHHQQHNLQQQQQQQHDPQQQQQQQHDPQQQQQQQQHDPQLQQQQHLPKQQLQHQQQLQQQSQLHQQQQVHLQQQHLQPPQHLSPLGQALLVTSSPITPSSSSSISPSKLDHHSSPAPTLDINCKPIIVGGGTIIHREILAHQQNDHHNHNLIPESNAVTIINLQCANPVISNTATATTTINMPLVQLPLPPLLPQPLPSKPNERFPPMSDLLSEEYNNQRYHNVVVPGYDTNPV